MIVKINKQGFSFKGIVNYLTHAGKEENKNRVNWSETGNLHTRDLEKAAKIMAFTDLNSEHSRQKKGSLVGKKEYCNLV